MGDPVSGSIDFGTQDFSVEAWVKATANDERAIISKRPYSATPPPFWQLTVTDDGSQIGRIRVNYGDGTMTREVYGPAVRVDDGVWHHVVVLFDRDTGIIVYVDGTNVRANVGAIPGDISNTGVLLVGKSPGYGNFKGNIDEVALYAGLLSPARIAAHHESGANGPPPDTEAPETTINSGPPALTGSTSASFAVSATEPGTLECSLDGAAFSALSLAARVPRPG